MMTIFNKQLENMLNMTEKLNMLNTEIYLHQKFDLNDNECVHLRFYDLDYENNKCYLYFYIYHLVGEYFDMKNIDRRHIEIPITELIDAKCINT